MTKLNYLSKLPSLLEVNLIEVLHLEIIQCKVNNLQLNKSKENHLKLKLIAGDARDSSPLNYSNTKLL